MSIISREERAYRRKKMKKRRANRIYQIAAVLFVLVLAAVVIANFLKKDVSFSESENRILTEKPQWSLQEVISGDFMTQTESYVADQFIFRDSWIQLKLQLDKLMGKKESNGVYLGKEGYLMEVLDEPNEEYVERNLQAIGEYSQRHQDLNIYMTLVPNAAYILKDKMPANAPVRDQAKDIQRVQEQVGDKLNFIDVTETLQDHSSDPIYYKTDHHWTSLGARYAFEEMADDLGITPTQDYEVYTVSDSFSGTLASTSGYHGQEDTIEIYEPQNVDNDYVVFYADDQERTTTIFDRSCLKEKDQYTVFFGGNHTRIDIESPNPDNRCLLMFKDSYANSYIQFLTPYFRKIIMIDPRYYYDNVEQLMASEGITDVLFLYNLNTFLTDTSLADVLAVEEIQSGEETVTEEGGGNTEDTATEGESGNTEETVTNGESENTEGTETEGESGNTEDTATEEESQSTEETMTEEESENIDDTALSEESGDTQIENGTETAEE